MHWARQLMSSHEVVEERHPPGASVEERQAAKRAVTEQARAWHAKLAEDFAQRADSYNSIAVNA